MLEVAGLEAGYGRARVLFGVDLDVAAGEVVLLAGHNGAGKSTTLKAMMGIVSPTRGSIRFGSRSIEHLPSFEIARAGLGYVPEDRRVFPELSVDENLEVGRIPERRSRGPWSRARVVELFPALAALGARQAGTLSGGEQQMLAIARTLMGNPVALLLDEPSEGLAPRLVADMERALRTMKASGLALLLSEQNVAFAGRIADRACLLEQGRIRFTGTPSELRENLFP
jgi:branched-chain amino acid transport system ATP-binding protein